MENEIWKDINGYEGYYQVSNLGQVKSLSRFIKYKGGGVHFLEGRILKHILTKTGYYVISTIVDNKRKQHFIHSLLAQHFIPNPNNYPQVNHISGIKTDFSLENLEWCTQRQNNIHAYKTGLKLISDKQKRFIGEYSRMNISRKVIQMDVNGKVINSFNSITEASEKTGAHKTAISACCRGIVKTSKSFKFKYAC